MFTCMCSSAFGANKRHKCQLSNLADHVTVAYLTAITALTTLSSLINLQIAVFRANISIFPVLAVQFH